MHEGGSAFGSGVALRSAARSTAERARALTATSSSSAWTRPREYSTGWGISLSRRGRRAYAAAGLAAAAMHCLTMRSSSE